MIKNIYFSVKIVFTKLHLQAKEITMIVSKLNDRNNEIMSKGKYVAQVH